MYIYDACPTHNARLSTRQRVLNDSLLLSFHDACHYRHEWVFLTCSCLSHPQRPTFNTATSLKRLVAPFLSRRPPLQAQTNLFWFVHAFPFLSTHDACLYTHERTSLFDLFVSLLLSPTSTPAFSNSNESQKTPFLPRHLPLHTGRGLFDSFSPFLPTPPMTLAFTLHTRTSLFDSFACEASVELTLTTIFRLPALVANK